MQFQLGECFDNNAKKLHIGEKMASLTNGVGKTEAIVLGNVHIFTVKSETRALRFLLTADYFLCTICLAFFLQVV